MNKHLSFGAIAVLAFMILALGLGGYISGADIRFQHPDRITASIAHYNRMVERGELLAALRGKFLSLRDQMPARSLAAGPGETTGWSRRRLDQPF